MNTSLISAEAKAGYLEALVRAQIRAASGAAEGRGQTIDFKVRGSTRPVLADARCLSQAVSYMLLNAVRLGCPDSCVQVVLDYGASEAVLSIRAVEDGEPPQVADAQLEDARTTLEGYGGSLKIGVGPDGGMLAAALPLMKA